MAAPVFAPSTPGNAIASISVAAGKNAATFLDISANIEWRVVCETVVGASAPTVVTGWTASEAYGTSGAATLTAAPSAGATSISVSNTAGMHLGQRVLIQHAGSVPQVGEVVNITGIASLVLTVTALTNGYSIGDTVYLFAQTSTVPLQPSSASGTYAINTDYSAVMALGEGQWCLEATNGDGTVAVTVAATANKFTSFA